MQEKKRKRSASATSSVASEDDDDTDILPSSSSKPVGAGSSESAAYSGPQLTTRNVSLLFNCIACIDPKNPCSTQRLRKPTTLPCGHTVCNSHILFDAPPNLSTPRPLRCPVPNCSGLPPTPHSVLSLRSNTVRCYPFLARGPAPSLFDASQFKHDVKISKLLAIIGEGLIDTPKEDSGTDVAKPTSQVHRRSGKLPRITNSGDDDVLRKDLQEVLTCEVCLMLLYEPLTSHCGHTFCATCLQKTLDGHPKCPLCREDFNVSFKASIYASEMQLGELPINRVLLGILMQFFSKEYLSRKLLITRETEHLITSRFNTPIYVFAKLMLPGSKNLITFAQPRERAMLRSILSAQRATFGMMLPPRGMIPHASGIIHSYGTLVEIKSVQVFPEFRSVAEVEAISRFRVIESQLHDGYVVARVESIEDYPAPDLDILHPVEEASTPTSSDLSPGQGSASVAEEQAIETSRLVEPAGTSVTVAELRNSSPSDEMIALCREFVQQLRSGSAPFVVQHVNQNYGDEPTDPDALVWWVAALLPRDDHEKSRLLAIRSPVLRLRLICHWIRELHAKWWYQSGCVIS